MISSLIAIKGANMCTLLRAFTVVFVQNSMRRREPVWTHTCVELTQSNLLYRHICESCERCGDCVESIESSWGVSLCSAAAASSSSLDEQIC